MEIKPVEESIKKEILKVDTVKLIYLYGSILTPAFNEESDIDCAIYCEKSVFNKAYYKTKTNIEFLLQRDVDLVNIKTADPAFATEIIYTGKLIYASEKAFKERFEMRIFAEYLTLEEDRAVVLEAVYKRGRVF